MQIPLLPDRHFKTDLLNPANNRNVPDNSSKGEREALKSLQ